MQPTKHFGNQGEESVAVWLEKHGAIILARNYQTRFGEVDIIATKGDIIVFVEVKTRHKEYFPISQTVTFKKQQRIIKAASDFIFKHQIRDKVFRFDVATVICQEGKISIEYIKNAFQRRA
jgi:putative endonuclease